MTVCVSVCASNDRGSKWRRWHAFSARNRLGSHDFSKSETDGNGLYLMLSDELTVCTGLGGFVA